MFGDGSAETPWGIENYDDLKAVSNGINTQTTYLRRDHYILAADIDASASATEDETEPGSGVYQGFVPIGTPSWGYRFQGTFDGQGHTISNLYINRSSSGLFRFCGQDAEEDGSVRNVNLVDFEMHSTATNNGPLVVYFHPDSTGTIENCYAQGIFRASGDTTGGLVGSCSRPVINCFADVDIIGPRRIGGLVGSAGDGFSATDCGVRGTIECTHESTGEMGGIVGLGLAAHTITNCYAAIEYTLAGTSTSHAITSRSDATVTDCFYDATLAPVVNTTNGGSGKTTAEMKSIDTYTNTENEDLTTAWDMVAKSSWVDETWYIGSYPELGFMYTSAPAASAPMPQYIYGE